MNETETLAEELKEKTGIEFFFYAEGGNNAVMPHGGFDDILSDERQKVTFFKFSIGEERYIGYIYGSGITEYNYAVMIKKLAESGAYAERSRTKEEALLSVLYGKEGKGGAEKFRQKYSLPQIPCYVIFFKPEKQLKEVKEIVRQAAGNSDLTVETSDGGLVLIKFDDGNSDYHSASEYAGFLSESIFEETGSRCLIGIGGEAENFSAVSRSFYQASVAVRMAKNFSPKGYVHTYKEFLLVRILEEIPSERREEYVSELLSGEAASIFADEEMVSTAEEFMSDNLNLSETSRHLFMHRNTLLYRLDKIERMTGMNIRNFSDAVSFRVLTLLYKLINEQEKE